MPKTSDLDAQIAETETRLQALREPKQISLKQNQTSVPLDKQVITEIVDSQLDAQLDAQQDAQQDTQPDAQVDAQAEPQAEPQAEAGVGIQVRSMHEEDLSSWTPAKIAQFLDGTVQKKVVPVHVSTEQLVTQSMHELSFRKIGIYLQQLHSKVTQLATLCINTTLFKHVSHIFAPTLEWTVPCADMQAFASQVLLPSFPATTQLKESNVQFEYVNSFDQLVRDALVHTSNKNTLLLLRLMLHTKHRYTEVHTQFHSKICDVVHVLVQMIVRDLTSTVNDARRVLNDLFASVLQLPFKLEHVGLQQQLHDIHVKDNGILELADLTQKNLGLLVYTHRRAGELHLNWPVHLLNTWTTLNNRVTNVFQNLYHVIGKKLKDHIRECKIIDISYQFSTRLHRIQTTQESLHQAATETFANQIIIKNAFAEFQKYDIIQQNMQIVQKYQTSMYETIQQVQQLC